MAAKAKAERLKLTLQEGHKGTALVFPFDPAVKWGKRTRHFVGGTLNGVRFAGEIGFRRRVFYTLIDDELLAAAGVSAGDEAEVVVVPREGDEADLATPANLVWSRLAAPVKPKGKSVQPPMRRKR